METQKQTKPANMKNQIVIDANNAILGRLASFAAKQALFGKSVVIVNCNDAVVAGKKDTIKKEYQEKRQRGGSSLKGPFFPKSPEKIVKRTVRGMLPYKQGRGSEALKRIMCYNTTPTEYANSKKLIAGKPKNIKTIKLSELSRLI